ncbi:xanthine dehydrogenase family protein molybdopterin-binding subunit [Streptomyces antimicrobicus]|uniref:Xanthine dehydrogenase family protein molybdopterin-binding subunit n=1 Tax=Streptomyces antimicrobicus TaxID=2883108 RepID=A0ABS8BG01_9ACTN|nr:xanthine dehydrogenase family protein molybdopterin-binding subunit [Streptomyces antimicrobicus]MCB5183459.1 xanthine dehydrogenase family protein molybdopterin-binding subunit [Streptomyces antimicrobicus]
MSGALGRSVPRLEDDRLLRGRGRFHDDVVRPGQLWLRVVRSPLAHAEIRGVDTARAAALPGVVAVVTAADLPAHLRIPVRQPHPGLDFTPHLQPPLARGHVRYAGEPVAAVLAEDPYLAEDAAELVALDLAEREPVLDARTAPAATCEVGVVDFGYGDVDAAFAGAAHVVAAELRTGRHSGTPLEPRGLVAEPDPDTGRLTVWGAAKIPHINRRVLATLLALPEHRIHLRETDAGGSFGIRGEFYPEDFLVPFLALRTGRPVKWSEDRAEHMVAANHAREQEHRIELALDADGRLLALRDEAWLDNGGYVRTHGAVVAALTASMISGPYRLPACRSRVHIVKTNKTPIGTYRAPGRFQHNFVREHALDLAATRLGLDPVELRRRNLLTAAELPHERPMSVFGSPMLLDGKDHLEHFDKALADVGYDRWRAEAAEARAQGRLVGTGCAVILEKAGLGYDSAVVDIGVTGAVRVVMGGANVGQGIQTVMAQIAADTLAVPVDSVHVVLSDTDLLPDGGGTFGSRSTVVGGTAVRDAAAKVLDKARAVAAELLGAAPGSLVARDGGLAVEDAPDRRLDWGAIAAASYAPRWTAAGDEVGLIGRATYAAQGMTYPYGAHFAQVEVDPDTGKVDVTRYAVTYEVGRAVHPEAVRGQLLGGAVQGIGGALTEEFRYDERGVPQSLTLDTYLWPRADELPDIQVEVYEDAPAPGNPLGLRGAGEGGTAGSGAVLAGAVRDALGLAGDVGALPLHPWRVRSLMSLKRAEEPARAPAEASTKEAS